MRWVALLLGVTVCMLAGCSATPAPSQTVASSPTAAPEGTAVRVEVPGGPALAGRLYGSTATHAVVLVPAPGEDTGGLETLARALAVSGTPALVVAIPSGAPDALIAAVHAAVTFLEGWGAQRVALVGEGAGGTLALAAGTRASAVVALSAPASYRFDGGEVDGAVAVRRIERPVLFMAALSDRDAAAAAQRLYDAARDPRSLALVPGAARGARLLTGPDAGQALILLQDFLRRAFSPLSA